ncbi:MAG: DUF2892 domain-containing protein [Spirochaetales bacterium]|nr:DUF2892 domain-containing protein [Spirochaetales bacterium]
MQCNVGKSDRIFRIIIGLVIVAVGLLYQSWWGLIGLIPLATGMFRFCPMYVPFKLNTDKAASKKS